MRQRIDGVSFWLGTGIAVAALLTTAVSVDLWRHPAEFVPGVLRTEIPGGCSLMHYTLQSEQPFRTITLDCPGVDNIRVGPLPPVWPWSEDWFEQPALNPRRMPLGIYLPSTRPDGRSPGCCVEFLSLSNGYHFMVPSPAQTKQKPRPFPTQ